MNVIDFREPADINELESLFRLRNMVYAEDPSLYKMVSTKTDCDINEFDINALHFAGFDGNKPIAYIRMVTAAETSFTNFVKTIATSKHIVINEPPLKFPFLSFYPDATWSEQFLHSLHEKKVGEVGKLAIHKDYRNGGIVLDQLILSFIKYCIEEQQFDSGFGSCMLSLERYYRRFGFERAEGAVPFIHGGLPEAVIVKFDK